MSAPQTGALQTYNSLTDKHLVGYFSNVRVRRHLQRAGLISRTGRIIPEKEYRINVLKRDHKKCIQECLAQTIFHEALDIEHHHQLKIERELENSMRKERAQKVKVEQSRRLVEDAGPMHFPHPPLGPRNHCRLRPLMAEEPAGCSQLRARKPVVDDKDKGGRPSLQHQAQEFVFSKTTSGNRQQPFRLPPLCSCAAVGSVPKASSAEQKHRALEYDQQFASGGERSGLRLRNSVEYVTGISPYKLPVINNYVMPVPLPVPPKGDKSINAVRSGMLRSRRFRPITVPNYREQLLTKKSGEFPKPSLRSNVLVTMVFLGKTLHLARGDTDYRDEIKVYQQHCGGENLCVYKGKLLEGETFQFVSKRHHGFPFSLTFFLNGIQVDRLSCCCEYKHHKRTRLGGRHGYFSFLNVEGGSPCYRCFIAMGLNKTPFPLRRKMENHEEKHGDSWRDGAHSEPSKRSVEQETSKSSVLVILPRHEESVKTSEDKMKTGHDYRKEEKKICDCENEDSQEDTGKNEYGEAIEADGEDKGERQTDDEMDGMSESSSDYIRHNLDYEEESRNSSQKARQASDSEEDESDEYSDGASEDDKQDPRPACFLSPISTQCSSENDSQAEIMKDDVENEEEYNIKRASDNAARAQYGNQNGENKQLRKEENWETSALGKEERDETENAKPEDLTAREDTGIFHENIMAIQHQSSEVNGECKQTCSMESETGEDVEENANTRDDGEENLLVPLENNTTDMEDSNEESPQRDSQGGPDGAFLAEGTRTPDVQKAAEQVVQEGQMVEEREALGKEDFVAEGGDAYTEEAREKMAWAGDFLPEEDTVAVQQMEGQLVVEESTLEESTTAEEDHKGMGTENRIEPDAKVACGEQEVLMEEMESEAALEVQGEELAGALLGREADGVACEGEEVAVEVSEGEEATEEASEAKEAVGATGPLVEEVVGKTVSEAEEAIEEEGPVSEGEEAVEDAHLAGEGIAMVAGSEGDEAVEEAISEPEEPMEKPGALLEGLGDTNIHTGEATLKGKDFANPNEDFANPNEAFINPKEAFVKPKEDIVNPNEFSCLKAAGEEQMEMGKVAVGTATSDTDKTSEEERNSLMSAEDAVDESVEPDKNPVWQVASGFEALVVAGEDRISEGTSQWEETTAAGEEEGAAETHSSEIPSLGSKAKTEHTMKEKPGGGVMGISAEKGRAESGVGRGVMSATAGPSELEAGMEGSLECAKEGEERVSGEGAVDGAALPAPMLCVGRMGEAGLVAFAVVGGQAGLGALTEAVVRQEVAGGGRLSEESVVQEKVLGAVWSELSVTGMAAPEGVSAEGRGTAWETEMDREGGVAHGAMACGQGANWEVALGCEESMPAPAEAKGQDEAGWEWRPAHHLSAQHGEPCGAMSQAQPAAPGIGAEEGEGWPQEGTEQLRVKAEGEQPGLCENMGEREGVGVFENVWNTGVREQMKDSPVGGSPVAPGATDAFKRSCDPCEDVSNPDAVAVPSVQPLDGKETLL